ncbi:hypothetical protein QZH41_005661 [Actinostola sp. cb2023]|nr:hypothetical protein QZH41_005661 [Actinostola sp. cb2023]
MLASSVTIEGGWYSDSSSQGSREELTDGEQLTSENTDETHEDVENGGENGGENDGENDGENGDNYETADEDDDYQAVQQSSQLLQGEDHKHIYSDSESDDVSRSSMDSKNNESQNKQNGGQVWRV